MSDDPRIWALTDARAGHTAHTLGVLQGLGADYSEKKLHDTFLASLPLWLMGKNLQRYDASSRQSITQPWPLILVSSGRRLVPAGRYIKRHSPHTRWIHCLWPGTRYPEIDVQLAPSHDQLKASDNALTFLGALHPLTEPVLAEEARRFAALFHGYPKPHIGVLIGGTSGKHRATIEDLHHLIDTAALLAQGGTLFITTSRRSPELFIDAIHRRLSDQELYYLYDWRSTQPNPYRGYLASCDAFIVSGDSVSMVSEACFTGKPVLVDIHFSSMRHKHHHFIHQLSEGGFVLPLSADCPWQGHRFVTLRETSRVANLIKEYLKNAH